MLRHFLALTALAATLGAAEVQPRMLLLSGAVVGTEVIVAGERGTILRSSDNARTWQAAPRVAAATLTGVTFAADPGAPARGWAVGHDALILGSTDAGRTWAVQYQGENLQDSFLDVLALDARHVVAVGAYGLFLETKDGGKSWARRKLGDDDFHLNRLTRGPGGTLYLAGERGTVLRSGDAAATWAAIATPYSGSFYGVLPLGERVLLAYGLRGHIFRSVDDGRSWDAVASPAPVLLASAIRLKNMLIAVAGGAGTLLVSRDDGKSFAAAPEPPTKGVAALLELPDGSLLALGEAGATRIETARLAPGPR